jgi:hypothetical protein
MATHFGAPDHVLAVLGHVVAGWRASHVAPRQPRASATIRARGALAIQPPSPKSKVLPTGGIARAWRAARRKTQLI